MYKNINHRTRKILIMLMLFILFLIPSKVINATSLEEIYKWSRDTFMSYSNTSGSYSTTDKYAYYTGRVVCINEKSGTTSWGAMKLYNILDINAKQSTDTLTTATTRGANSGSLKHKQAAKLAYVAWYGTSKEPNKSSSYSKVQTYFWHGGWSKAYNALKSILSTYVNASGYGTFDADQLNVTKQLNTEAENYANWANSFQKITSVTTSPKVKYENGNTKIGPYKIKYYTNTTNKYTVKTDKGEFTGTITAASNSNFYITIPKVVNKITEIKITNSYSAYRARLMLFAAGSNYAQGRAVLWGEKKSQSDSIYLTIPPMNVEVSLQKYITHVNSEKITINNTDYINRSNRMTYKDETNTYVKKKISIKNTASDTYKYDSPVKITKGDTVTYRIYVYNNSEVKAESILVKDRIPGNYANIVQIYDSNKNTVSYTYEGENVYFWTVKNLDAKASTYFDVTLLFNTYSKRIQVNTAWISDTTPDNFTQYRTTDRDYITMSLPKTSFAVKKEWNDEDNKDNGRTESITVQLFKTINGTTSSMGPNYKIVLNSSNGWEYKWDSLNKEDESANVITYSVKEYDSEGKLIENLGIGTYKNKMDYQVQYQVNSENTFCTIKNTHTPYKTIVTVEKVWEDAENINNGRPESIKVVLYKNGQPDSDVTLNESNKWSYTWDYLDKYENGREIEYTVKELGADNKTAIENNGKVTYKNNVEYTASYTVDNYTKVNNLGEGTTHTICAITNKYIPNTTNYKVEKIWLDDNNSNNIRPENITVKLYRTINGKKELVEQVKLNDSNSWQYEWKGLTTGKNITYSVEEINVPGYITSYTSTDASTIITNTYGGEEEVETKYSVKKIWENDNTDVRPSEIVVQLCKTINGEAVACEGDYAIVKLNDQNGWEYTWENLPKKDGRIDIAYQVIEVTVPTGYEVEYRYGVNASWINTTIITNKYDTENPPSDPDIAKVSLEKYITKVTNESGEETIYSKEGNDLKEIYSELMEYIGSNSDSQKIASKLEEFRNKSDMNGDGRITSDDLEILTRVIDSTSNSYSQKIKNLVNAFVVDTNEDGICNYNDFDFNEDGKVDEEDYYIKRTIALGIISDNSKFAQYIETDINEDGKVDNLDLEIYEIIKSDIDSDFDIDDVDLYELYSLMCDINSDNKINAEDLHIIKAKLVQQSGIDVLTEIDNFIKSDIDDDGIINQSDKKIYDIYEDNKNSIDTKISVAERNAAAENKEFNIKSIIIENDVDGSGAFDDIDVTIVQKFINSMYGGFKKYTTVEEIDLYIEELMNREDLDEYTRESSIQGAMEYKSLLRAGKNYDYLVSKYSHYNISNVTDMLMIISDNDLWKEAEEQEGVRYVGELNALDLNIYKLAKNEKNFNSKYIDISDSQFDYLKFDSEDTILSLLDINNDGKITSDDKECYELNADIQVDNKYVTTEFVKYFEDFINRLKEIDLTKINTQNIMGDCINYITADINSDGKVDDNDLQELNDIIVNKDSFDLNSDGTIDELDIELINFEEDSSNMLTKMQTYIKLEIDSDEDVAKIKELIEILSTNINDNSSEGLSNNTLVNNNISIDNSYLDINNDGLIDNSDLYIIQKYINADINSDGIIDNNEVIIINKYKDNSTIYELYLNQNQDSGVDYYVNCSETTYSLISDSIGDLASNNGTIPDIDINSDGKSDLEDYSIIKDLYNNIDDIDNVINKVSKILEAEETKNIDFIQTIINNELTEDGIFNKDDQTIYDNIENMDINGDGEINESDKELFILIMATKDLDADQLLALMQGGEYSVTREGHPIYSKIDPTYKKEHIVQVNNGDTITYNIKIRNDGEKSVYINEVTDTFNIENLQYIGITSVKKFSKAEGTLNDITNLVSVERGESPIKFNISYLNLTEDTLLEKDEYIVLTISMKVKASNMSLDTLINTAEITDLKNENGFDIEDSTPEDNKDEDYAQLRDITIAGTVWNDTAPNKVSTYDGLYNNNEKPLGGIKVYLYRGNTLVSEKETDESGKYYFTNNDLNIQNPSQRHIKAEKDDDDIEWKENGYYSYYIVFEYDGITYTSTIFKDVTSDDSLDSNAKEDGEKVKENRETFNNRFSKINNTSGIEYITENKKGYIPKSKYVYDPIIMGMQSSTSLIRLSDSSKLESQLQHVNLGLIGRDVFDLELISDVDNVKVTVNGKQGVYNYGNKVTLRESDINHTYVDTQNQPIRTTDIKNDAYEDTGLGIEVTYKITVTNASQTDGTATKITNYYDSRYKFKGAYRNKEDADSNSNRLTYSSHGISSKYNYVVIDTPRTNLTQSASMDIYVVLQLNSPTTALASLLNGTKAIPTYNMTEITEYTTKCREGQTEYTRGLIDKDSAPGSVNREKVRTTETEGQNTATKGQNPTTLEYYFSDNDLSKLKYEDDTYAAPTLYFVSSDNQRTINGTVFRDETTTDEETRIKTGNGKQDEGELGVYGATVELIEQVGDGKVRYTVNSGKDGKYTISGFLPGNYIIRYRYGDKIETVLLNQSDDGSVNKYSFNGEDYQATNNIGTYGAAKLNSEPSFWYIYNEKEGISTGTENAYRRSIVSENVTNFTDEQMAELNNIRKGDNTDAIKSSVQAEGGLIEKTNMHAETPSMIFEVEETVIDNGNLTNRTSFGEYNVSNMNFGLAEVPVTTIDLQKYVTSFIIKDSTGQNIIAGATYNEETQKWDLKGDVLLADTYNVQIEDKKLQGARLQVTYTVKANMTTEKNFDNKSVTVPTINGIVDFVDNNLSYNPSLGDNDKYWEITTYEDTQKAFNPQYDGTNPKGTVDPDGTKHTVIVKAKSDNPILLNKTGEGKATITLEKILSSTDSTIADIIQSTVEPYLYLNTVEITNLTYENVTSEGLKPQRDRIRTPEKYIIIPGVQYDSATSEIISIVPPTGGQNYMPYYVIAVMSLGILAIGVFCIKKFIVNSKK